VFDEDILLWTLAILILVDTDTIDNTEVILVRGFQSLVRWIHFSS
jgi:hypothetical protein